MREEDPIVKEVDVFLSKQLTDHLFLLQYPVRPSHLTYDEICHLDAKFKPKQYKLEVEVAINTVGVNYDKSKGEQVAINVDGSIPGEKPFYSSEKMDKQVLSSSPSGVSTSRYAVGSFRDGDFHLTPIQSLIHMRPSFGYLDKVENHQIVKADNGDTSQDEEEAKAVTVKFARRETAEGKARRLASYDHLRKTHDEESWVKLHHHPVLDSYSEKERQFLFLNNINEISEFHTDSYVYLDKLIPKMQLRETEKPKLPTNVLSMTDLKKMTLNDQVRALLINARVIRTSHLLSLLSKGTDSTAMIRCLQQVALLVQGCWVVKSEVLYPKETASPYSGAPADSLCRARDYVMWRFTQSRYIVRKDITPVVKLVAEDVKDMLEQISRLKVNKGWEFLFDCDTEFINRHPDVVQRQSMIWEAKFKQLSASLKLPQSDLKLATMVAANPQTSPKRKRSVSRSQNKSQDRFESASDTDAQKSELLTNVPGSSSDHSPFLSNHMYEKPKATDNPGINLEICEASLEGATMLHVENAKVDENHLLELKNDLQSFVKEKLCRHYVMKLSDLKSMFNVFLTQLPAGHKLGSGISEKLLEQTVYDIGGIRMLNTLLKQEEPIFATSKIGDPHDSIREALLDFLQKNIKFQTKALKKFIEESLNLTIEDNILKKIIREYCDYKSGYYHLKGYVHNST